jgi:hypothetical protein
MAPAIAVLGLLLRESQHVVQRRAAKKHGNATAVLAVILLLVRVKRPGSISFTP